MKQDIAVVLESYDCLKHENDHLDSQLRAKEQNITMMLGEKMEL